MQESVIKQACGELQNSFWNQFHKAIFYNDNAHQIPFITWQNTLKENDLFQQEIQ